MRNHDRLFSERDTPDDTDGDRVAVDTSGCPIRHERENADRFAIERFFDALQNADMADRTVGIDHKGTSDASLNAGIVGFLGVLPRAVDKFEKAAVSTGIARLFRHIVIFVNFHISGMSFARSADRNAACLSFGIA